MIQIQSDETTRITVKVLFFSHEGKCSGLVQHVCSWGFSWCIRGNSKSVKLVQTVNSLKSLWTCSYDWFLHVACSFLVKADPGWSPAVSVFHRTPLLAPHLINRLVPFRWGCFVMQSCCWNTVRFLFSCHTGVWTCLCINMYFNNVPFGCLVPVGWNCGTVVILCLLTYCHQWKTIYLNWYSQLRVNVPRVPQKYSKTCFLSYQNMAQNNPVHICLEQHLQKSSDWWFQ